MLLSYGVLVGEKNHDSKFLFIIRFKPCTTLTFRLILFTHRFPDLFTFSFWKVSVLDLFMLPNIFELNEQNSDIRQTCLYHNPSVLLSMCVCVCCVPGCVDCMCMNALCLMCRYVCVCMFSVRSSGRKSSLCCVLRASMSVSHRIVARDCLHFHPQWRLLTPALQGRHWEPGSVSSRCPSRSCCGRNVPPGRTQGLALKALPEGRSVFTQLEALWRTEASHLGLGPSRARSLGAQRPPVPITPSLNDRVLFAAGPWESLMAVQRFITSLIALNSATLPERLARLGKLSTEYFVIKFSIMSSGGTRSVKFEITPGHFLAEPEPTLKLETWKKCPEGAVLWVLCSSMDVAILVLL